MCSSDLPGLTPPCWPSCCPRPASPEPENTVKICSHPRCLCTNIYIAPLRGYSRHNTEEPPARHSPDPREGQEWPTPSVMAGPPGPQAAAGTGSPHAGQGTPLRLSSAPWSHGGKALLGSDAAPEPCSRPPACRCAHLPDSKLPQVLTRRPKVEGAPRWFPHPP